MGIIDNYFKKIMSEALKESAPPTMMPTITKAAGDNTPAIYDVPLNANLGYPFGGYTNRKDNMSVSFDTLKVFSINYDVARACINHRKRQIQNLEWEILPKDEKKKPESFKGEIETITKFFEKPAYMNDFTVWTDKLIEDMLVYDAIVLWKDKTFGNQLVELVPVDASTIRIKITDDGFVPEPPEVAYQQIIKGVKHGEWSTEQMMYEIMNPRNSSPYGLGPLESLIIGVDAALKAQMYNSNLLSEGNVPEGFVMVPPNWTPQQIKEYQVWFDSLMSGNSRFGNRIKFLPGGTGVGYTPTKKAEDMRFMEMEKWLLQKTCALFDVQPSDIGFLESTTYNNSEGQKQAGLQRGLIPTCLFLKRMFNKIISEDLGNSELKFEWKGLQVTDDTFELERDKAMVVSGAFTIDEWRTKQGLKPFNLDYTSKPFVMSNGIPMLLESVDKEKEQANANAEALASQLGEGNKEEEKDPKETTSPEDTEDEEAIEEMVKWETKCINSLKRGKGIPVFKTDKIDPSIQTLIRTKLLIAKSKEDVKEAFKIFKDTMQEKVIIGKAINLSADISKYKQKTYADTR